MSTVIVIPGDQPILVLDDNEIDRMVIEQVLRRSLLRNEVRLFGAGEDLLAFLEDVERGDAPFPSLILIDINMPGLDGHEVLQRIRSRAAFDDLPVIAMLTSSIVDADRDRAMAHGANDYIVKAVGIDAYVAQFNERLGNPPLESGVS